MEGLYYHRHLSFSLLSASLMLLKIIIDNINYVLKYLSISFLLDLP